MDEFKCDDADNAADIQEGIQEYLAIELQVKHLNEKKRALAQDLLGLGAFSWDINPNLRVYTGKKKVNKIDNEAVYDLFSIHPDFRKFLSKNALLAGALKSNDVTKECVTEIIEEKIEIKKADPEAIANFVFNKERAQRDKAANE